MRDNDHDDKDDDDEIKWNLIALYSMDIIGTLKVSFEFLDNGIWLAYTCPKGFV